ncbi:MAG: hypothetical protein GTO53_00075 [Planctomycetales bacterium]|nr:hypothetical protein [Planctomycetales bacterium]NIM07578.1 hypothetical protein [Planctomycetales bacterium]NIN07084.1 hypothetical protein [Planctomycetales bacterium]NIN76178.1 hypothetical protein [Planctomycetales bacterium]NIO33400.1 hypothetical protein [Planctomycetales bacterium]
MSFDPQAYPSGLAQLLTDEDQSALGAGKSHREVEDALAGLDLVRAFSPHKIVDITMARACHSGLWLLHNYLEESHAISQKIGNASGSFWHGIMHRREGDYANAKYWFRRVGDHDVYPALAAAAHQIDADLFADLPWNPSAFVDLCAAAAGGDSAMVTALRRVARCEWELLFEDSYRQAIT